MKAKCKCPYIPCPIRGKCELCMAESVKEGTLVNCMEDIAEKYGATLPVTFPKTELLDDYEEMSMRTAEIVRMTLKEKPDALLCFPAGSTVIKTCEILKNMHDNNEIDFSMAKFVALDEWVGLDDPTENCTHFMMEHLYRPLNIQPENLVLFDPKADDLVGECKRIDEFIFSQQGIDLMILGIGMNGHLGLNEPGESFDSYAKVVKLSETTMNVGQKYFSKPTTLTKGITLGVKHMFEAKKVVLQISGKAKSDIVYKMYHSRPTEDLPATVLSLLPGGFVLVDKEAASKIKDIVEK